MYKYEQESGQRKNELPFLAIGGFLFLSLEDAWGIVGAVY